MTDRLALFGGLALLAIAFVIGSLFIGHGIRDKNRNDAITVTGSAKQRIVSDYVVWDFFVTSERPAAPAAARELNAWTAKIRSFLTGAGVTDRELSVDPISTETVSRKGKVVSFRLTRGFEVRSPRVRPLTDVADQSSQLLAQGIPLQADPLRYVYTKLPTLRPKLLAEATKDAQNRAKVIVDATGADLGKLRRVSVGVFQITSPNSTEVEDYGVYDTSTLEKDVTAVVNVTFALQ
ncbi:MAG: SIMPL domain-containing protein [Gaiellaceae bacterium]